MNKYLLNEDATKFVAMNEGETFCEADVVVEGDIARLDFVDIKRTKEDSLVNVAMSCCNEAKKLLTEKGIGVSKVQFGGILAVARYEETLSKIDANQNIKVGMR